MSRNKVFMNDVLPADPSERRLLERLDMRLGRGPLHGTNIGKILTKRPMGLLVPGNLDPFNRPVLHNTDGSIKPLRKRHNNLVSLNAHRQPLSQSARDCPGGDRPPQYH